MEIGWVKIKKKKIILGMKLVESRQRFLNFFLFNLLSVEHFQFIILFFLDFLLCEVGFPLFILFHKFHFAYSTSTSSTSTTINFITIIIIVSWLWHCTHALAAGPNNKIIISTFPPIFFHPSALFPSHFFPLPSLQTACKFVLILPPTFE